MYHFVVCRRRGAIQWRSFSVVSDGFACKASSVLLITASIPSSAHAVCLCILCGTQNKQPLFPYTALTDWFLYWTQTVLSVWEELDSYIRVWLLIKGTSFRMYVFTMSAFYQFEVISIGQYTLLHINISLPALKTSPEAIVWQSLQ